MWCIMSFVRRECVLRKRRRNVCIYLVEAKQKVVGGLRSARRMEENYDPRETGEDRFAQQYSSRTK